MGRRGGRRGGGGGGGGGPPIDRPRGGRSSTFVRPVGELARIDILNALEAFRADPEETNSSSLPTSIITSAPSCTPRVESSD